MNRDGISLLENLIAVVILLIIILGLAGIFVATKSHIMISRHRITAGELGRFYLSPLQMQVRSDQWSTNCLGTRNGALCAADPLLAPQNISGITFTPTFVIRDAPGSTTVRKVNLTISWNEP